MRGLRPRLLLMGFWILPAIVATVGLRVVPSRLNPGIPVGAIFACQLAMWGAWGIWSLLIVAVGDRVPFRRGAVGRALMVHALLCAVVVAAQIVVVSEVSVAFGLSEARHLDSMLAIGLRVYGDTFVVIFWGIVGAHVALRWYSAWQEQSVVTARLGQDLAQAQLRALQSQLNPHFLFNALNSVMTLIPRDPPAAQRMIVRLADLLRATLRAGETQEVPLQQELDFTARYLDIEQLRFADRLKVQWDVADGLDAAIPAFALQPLVENAVVHCIARRREGGEITVSALRDGDTIVMQVRDNGAGPDAGPIRPGAGLALANLRSRLERMYGDRATMRLVTNDGAGAAATLRIPYRPVPATG